MSDLDKNILDYFDAESIQTDMSAFSQEEQDILALVNQKIASSLSLDDVMSFLIDTTEDIFPCDRIGLAFLDEHGHRVVSRSIRTRYNTIILGTGYGEDFKGSSLQQVIESNQIRIINDLRQYGEMNPSSQSTKLLLEEGVLSSLTCPLKVSDRTIGLLFRSSRKTFAYDDHQVKLHVAMAEHLSQAVEKAWWIEQLTQANRAYMEMLSFVSHEIKSPLSSVVMDAQLFTQGYLGSLNEKQQEVAQRMINKTDYLLNLVRQYLDLARIEDGSLQLSLEQGVDFDEYVIEPTIQIIDAQVKSKSMNLVKTIRGDVSQTECDPQLMMIVLVNLLTNAVKYGNEGGQIDLNVFNEGNYLAVHVWNEGPGFSRDQQSQLFRRFSRLNTPELLSQKGTGIGLYTTWRIVHMHKGKVIADSEPGQWARFGFEIPQPIQG